jgi:two-component system chemotaxis response regulator CheY
MSVEALIVDDSEMFRMVLRKKLEPLGVKIVAEAPTAKEGLELFREKHPRLVTLDLFLPDPDQFTAKKLFDAIREESPETAVVVISAYSKAKHGEQFLEGGAAAYLEKSFMNFDEVRRRLKASFRDEIK